MDHIILGILFLVWGAADVLRLELPGILGKRLKSASAEARRLHPRAVLPLAEAGKREYTGMNHGRKQYGALVLRSREL